MKQHICNKEKEINQINSNIQLILNDMKYIKKTIDGNGKKGLIDKVRENTEYIIQNKERNYIKEKNIKLLFGSGVVFALLSLIINIIILKINYLGGN